MIFELGRFEGRDNRPPSIRWKNTTLSTLLPTVVPRYYCFLRITFGIHDVGTPFDMDAINESNH